MITVFDRIEVSMNSPRDDIANTIISTIAIAVLMQVLFVVSAYFCMNLVVSSSS